MRHALSDLRLAVVKLDAAGPTAGAHGARLVAHERLAAARGRGHGVGRERLAGAEGVAPTTVTPCGGGGGTGGDSGASWGSGDGAGDAGGGKGGAEGALFFPGRGRGRSGGGSFDVFVGLGVAAGEFALEAPEGGFGQDFDGGGVAPFDFPVDFGIRGALVVGAVVDDELVGVGEGAAFVGAAVENAGALEALPCADGGVDVFVGLAEGPVGLPAVEGVDGGVMAGSAYLLVVCQPGKF